MPECGDGRDPIPGAAGASRLHGYGEAFDFPPHFSPRQASALVGNSITVPSRRASSTSSCLLGARGTAGTVDSRACSREEGAPAVAAGSQCACVCVCVCACARGFRRARLSSGALSLTSDDCVHNALPNQQTYNPARIK